MQIDFTKIRSHSGSQNNGFEELVCQLANLQKPENAKTFIRKEGAGGDAGVECYWILEDGTEVAWQAKYFIDGMGISQWQQLDDSFKTALEKHSNLKKYIICMPFDLTDSRKKGRGGKQVISLQDEWNTWVQTWIELAKTHGRDMQFEYWGKHEITLYLGTDNPLYSGRVLYWFYEPTIGLKNLKEIAKRSRVSLGERYTPEFHVDLPLSENFEALASDPKWWKKLKTTINGLLKKRRGFFATFQNGNSQHLEAELLEELDTICSQLGTLLNQYLKNKTLIENLSEIQTLIEKIINYKDFFINGDKKDIFKEKGLKNELYVFDSFFEEYQSFLYFLTNSKLIKVARIRSALLHGEGGTGKSHLLCDLSLKRIKNGLPTLFLLGQHYLGNNPIETIKRELDLSSYSNKQVLGALDAAGEAYKTKALIIIDAINEGRYRDDWSPHIRAFLSEISLYSNIAVLLSCRTTYLNYMLPDTVDDSCLMRFQHLGFQGSEEKAADQYMSKQGIAKPSAPILAPEFSNPLFLKTCCKALKDNGLKTFPKGIQGISKLFDFYINSIEKTIAKRKKYNPAEHIVKNILIKFASKIFPDHLNGLSLTEARKFINGFDPNPNLGDSLFDELILEGVLSEDITYEDGDIKPVIRYTYERFSDYFISLQITKQYDNKSVSKIFSKNHLAEMLVEDNSYYRYEGIVEALSITVADQFNKELIDFLPKNVTETMHERELFNLFAKTVTWRAASSFTKRTLEILNEIRDSGYDDLCIEMLLKLSTEPSHPWNAYLIHKNLIHMKMAERDHFWSIHIAHGDYGDDDGDEKRSTIKTLIEWSHSGKIDEIEEERARLCSITLLWFLTTSNRRVRDRATKSLVRILTYFPQLLLELIVKFHNVDDFYLVERLYAVAYGVICNINDKKLISEISKVVYDLVFKDGKPVPHILLRDYARGIMECALDRELLSKHIVLEKFRPPYKSEWPIEIPSKEDIDKLVESESSSIIKNSLMGFPGDFGNYTMNCISNWSETSLSESKAKTGYDLKVAFAASSLEGELKEKYLEFINRGSDHNQNILKQFEIAFSYYDNSDERPESINLKFLAGKLKFGKSPHKKLIVLAGFSEEMVIKNLSDELKEYYHYLSKLRNDQPVKFDKKKAQRWVCKRVHEFGWKKELFDSFDRNSPHGRNTSARSSYLERIGKKYQWIALHELLARLSDNVHWLDRKYTDIQDENYYGPWQMHERDIDPTIWIRSNGDHSSYYDNYPLWWQKYIFPFDGISILEKQINFMWDKTIIPNFSQTLDVVEPKTDNHYLILAGFWKQGQEENLENEHPQLDCWFRINSIVAKKTDFKKIEKALQNQPFISPDTISIPSTNHQSFFAEYSWHTSCQFMENWKLNKENWDHELIPTQYFIPVSQYEWEIGNNDHSLDSSLNLYMPAFSLINDLKLSRVKNDFGTWVNEQGEKVFIDPSLEEQGPTFALIKKDIFLKWLDKNDLEILWLIGGEKQLLETNGEFHGRLVFNVLGHLEGSEISTNEWFENEQPSRRR